MQTNQLNHHCNHHAPVTVVRVKSDNVTTSEEDPLSECHWNKVEHSKFHNKRKALILTISYLETHTKIHNFEQQIFESIINALN